MKGQTVSTVNGRGIFLPENNIFMEVKGKGEEVIVRLMKEPPGEVTGTLEFSHHFLPVLHQYLGARQTLETALKAYLPT